MIFLRFPASPHRPSDRGSVKVEMVEWLETMASDRVHGILSGPL
jgi:hypothetical protein